MDQLFVELIDSQLRNPAQIITIVAENFPLHQDRAKFLRTVLAIPTVKALPLGDGVKRLIQLGLLHSEVGSQLAKDEHWIIDTYPVNGGERSSLCDTIASDLAENQAERSLKARSLIFFNDASRFLFSSGDDNFVEQRKFLKMIVSWKKTGNNFVVVLVQQTQPNFDSTFLRNLEYISDACVRVQAYKSCHMHSIWYQPLPTQRLLLPPMMVTHHWTCKIGKCQQDPELLCFTDCVRVAKNYDPDNRDSTQIVQNQGGESNEELHDETLERLVLDDEEEPVRESAASTLPYIRAQNPEHSRIFYYPDKDDDIDEDDPDNDLDI